MSHRLQVGEKRCCELNAEAIDYTESGFNVQYLQYLSNRFLPRRFFENGSRCTVDWNQWARVRNRRWIQRIGPIDTDVILHRSAVSFKFSRQKICADFLF